MNQQCKNGFVKRLRNETRPLQILLNNQTLTCFYPETKIFPDTSDVASLLNFPGSSNQLNQNMPVLAPDSTDKDFATLGNHSSIRFPSAFFLLVLQICKPASLARTRFQKQISLQRRWRLSPTMRS